MRNWMIVSIAIGLLSACVSTGQTINTPASNNNGQPRISESGVPENAAPGSVPAIVLMHGCNGIQRNVRDWAGRFVDVGWHVVVMDSHSPRIGGNNTCTTSFIPGQNKGVSVLDRVADAFGALDYLAAQSHVDPDRIYVMGWSEGATVAGFAQTQTMMRFYDREGHPHQFSGSISIAPACEVWAWEGKPLTKPALIIGGTADEWTPVSACQSFVQNPSQPNVRVHPIEGATHAFDNFAIQGSFTYGGHRMVPSQSATNEAVRVVWDFLDIAD